MVVVGTDDKKRIGDFIAEGKSHGIDFSALNFCSYDRSGPRQVPFLICQALNENQISHIRNFCSSLKCLFHRRVDWIGCAKVFLIVATL